MRHINFSRMLDGFAHSTSSANMAPLFRHRGACIIFITILALNVLTTGVHSQQDSEPIDVDSLVDLDAKSTDQQTASAADAAAKSKAKDKIYTSPKLTSDGIYLFDSFDDQTQFNTKWIQSSDPKYEGKWQLNSGPDRPHADLQLLLPLKARHYAISSKLSEPFKFSEDKPLVVQYEVQFREGLDCGGAYVKLLRHSPTLDLNRLTDKTPFTIMFGPDKCGSESKLHFIVQYLNPKTHQYEEKHWKQAKFVSNLLAAFTDKEHHLFRLVFEPSNNFEIFVDDKSVGKGNLLEDLDPPVNPPKEIVDSNDKKPADWDERVQIEDPDAKKPDDWDEDAPRTIEDPNAEKPDDWLESEAKYIADPNAKKPDDWEEMDGDWEAPLIENPACAKVSGCGEWKAPTIQNPNFKGKWKPPKIDNPNYKGKWAPRTIPNPDYYFDDNPFKSLDPIGAVSYELWSMADNLAFDNIIITNNVELANTLQHVTWQEKKLQADASSPSLLTRAMHYLKVNPWLWAVLVLAIALPLFLFISYCCDTKKRKDRAGQADSGRRKKADESRPDDKREDDVEDELVEGEEADEDDGVANEEEVDDEEEEEEQNDGDDDEVGGDDVKKTERQVRQRKRN